MMERKVIVFESTPQPPQPWMRQVCDRLSLTFVEPDEVARVMATDPAALPALLGSHGENPALAPHYTKALEVVAGGASRLALHSVSWLVYGQRADAVVVDLEGVAAERQRAAALGLPQAEVEQALVDWRRALETRLDDQGPPPERRLTLEPGLTADEKVKRSVEFLQPLLG